MLLPLKMDCLMKTKWGQKLYHSKALFNGWGRPSQNVNFIKGTLRNLQKNS